MDVFSAFPNAILTEEWVLGSVERATEVGNMFKPLGYLEAIADEGYSAQTDMSPNASQLSSDTMLFVKPSCITIPPARLMAGYLLKNCLTGQFYEIIDVGVGKNQEVGKFEHLELKIRQTEAEYGESEL